MAYKWTSKDKAEIFLSTVMIILMIVALYIGNNIIVNIEEVNEGLDRTTKIITACNACQEPEVEEGKLVPADADETEDIIDPVADIDEDVPVAGAD